jgi:DNA-binding transcriptional regulator YdaS (Cro superfamily)
MQVVAKKMVRLAGVGALARRVGVHPTHLTRVLRGERKPGARLECRMLKHGLTPGCKAGDAEAANG